jgi:hypothetical protein
VWTTRAKSILSAALLGAAWLGAAGSAQAAVYTGRYDPAYGGFFPHLGWEATAVFNLPCASLSDGAHLPSDCAGFSVLSATVDFYDIADSSVILESIQVPNASSLVPSGFRTTGGALTGVNTPFFSAVTPTLDIAGSGDYAFSLELLGDTLAQLIFTNPTTESPGCDQFPLDDGSHCGHSANFAHGHFTLAPIPEPETYALMLAGLGALGFLARRRRA